VEESKRSKKTNTTKPIKSTGLITCFGCGQPNSQYPLHSTSCFAKLENSLEVYEGEPSDYDPVYHIVYCDIYDKMSQSFCKKLKSSCPNHSGLVTDRKPKTPLYCGCPLRDGSYCEIERKDCEKHYDWEIIKQGEIYSLELFFKEELETIDREEKKLKKRVVKNWTKKQKTLQDQNPL